MLTCSDELTRLHVRSSTTDSLCRIFFPVDAEPAQFKIPQKAHVFKCTAAGGRAGRGQKTTGKQQVSRSSYRFLKVRIRTGLFSV